MTWHCFSGQRPPFSAAKRRSFSQRACYGLRPSSMSLFCETTLKMSDMSSWNRKIYSITYQCSSRCWEGYVQLQALYQSEMDHPLTAEEKVIANCLHVWENLAMWIGRLYHWQESESVWWAGVVVESEVQKEEQQVLTKETGPR